MTRPAFKNQILRRLVGEEFNALSPSLVALKMNADEMLVARNARIPDVWFPETGVITLGSASGNKTTNSVWIGLEGMTPGPLSTESVALYDAKVLLPGLAWRVEAAAFSHWLQQSKHALNLIYHYQQSLVAQAAHTAHANATCTVTQRVARVLLVLYDRNGASIPLTHEKVSEVMGMRRAGVTHALHILEGEGAIQNARGRIEIRDSLALDMLANGSYGSAEQAYHRMMSTFPDQLTDPMTGEPAASVKHRLHS